MGGIANMSARISMAVLSSTLLVGFESYLTPQYTHIAQLVRAGILYIQDQGFKSLCEYNNLKSMKIDFGNKGNMFSRLI